MSEEVKQIESDRIFSSHQFMFAFSWKYMPKQSIVKDFDSHTKLEDVVKLLSDSSWERIKKLKKEYFNEYTYFYEQVRRVAYDLNGENKFMNFFEYDISNEKNKTFRIEYYECINEEKDDRFKNSKENFISKTIELEIQEITMHLFATGAGIISFNLHNKNKNQKNKETILLINEYGRRIYPQFLNFEERTGKLHLNEGAIWNAQRAFLSKSIKLFENLETEEDFNIYNDINNIKSDIIRLPKYIDYLFKNVKIEPKINESYYADHLMIRPILDDRMFFVSWYGKNGMALILKDNYKNCDWWYCYLFGDKAYKSIANNDMQNKQIETHTYQRWSNYGTLFGMSKDSFVAVSSDEKTLTSNNAPNLRVHMESIYHKINVLCLAQRISVLNFSNEVSRLSDIAKKSDSTFKDKVQNLYANYIEFVNKLYFREVTSQIQGIEIYKQIQIVMNLDEEVKSLDTEIEELHTYLSMQEQTELGKLAARYLPITLLAGILGMNTIDKFSETNLVNGKVGFWILTGITCLLIFITAILYGHSFIKYLRHKISKFYNT